MTSSTIDKKLEIYTKLEIELEINKNLEYELEIDKNLENFESNFEFFVNFEFYFEFFVISSFLSMVDELTRKYPIDKPDLNIAKCEHAEITVATASQSTL